MNQRARSVPFAAGIIFLGSALQPVAAYVDRGGWGAGLPRRPLTAALGGLDLRAPELPPPKPASPRLRFAHAKVVRSFPESGAVVPETVGKVEIWYSDAIANAFVALAVINAAGDRVDKRDAAIDSADGSHVSVSVEALTPGEYTVRYRAVSADTHLVSGAWVFEVRHQ